MDKGKTADSGNLGSAALANLARMGFTPKEYEGILAYMSNEGLTVAEAIGAYFKEIGRRSAIPVDFSTLAERYEDDVKAAIENIGLLCQRDGNTYYEGPDEESFYVMGFTVTVTLDKAKAKMRDGERYK